MAKEGITVVSPMWGDRKITDRMVFSVIHQYISEQFPFNIHLVLVDDYIEGRTKDGKSAYEYYLSDEFKQFYDTSKIKIDIIINDEHKYQGESREIGYLFGEYKYFLLVDCDDIIAPNACDRYLAIIRNYKDAENHKQIASVFGLLYGFSAGGGETVIPGNSIWVQGRCYNRDFLVKHDIHFPTGLSSRQSEDYPFIRKLDYAVLHDNNYENLELASSDPGKPLQNTAFWFPNDKSLSRVDPHYGQHLSGWTMGSSNAILDFCDDFNKKNGFEDQEDEYMKHEYLNANIYGFYNLLDFIKEVASTDYEPLEDDWVALRDNVSKLRSRLKEKYWDEIVYSDIEDMLYQVKHFSDVRFTESWIGTFYDYINNHVDILDMSYSEMIKYAKTLEFDYAGHEIHSPQVIAWMDRHNVSMDDIKKDK